MTEKRQVSFSQKQNIVTIDEQEAMGLRRPRREMVQPEPVQQPIVRPMSEAESQALQAVTQLPALPQGQVISVPKQQPAHTSHARHTDDPITNAQASLLYSVAYGVAAGLVIFALLLLAAFRYGVAIDFLDGVGIEICVTGLVTIIAMAINRQQGLNHSAPGIERRQIKADETMHSRTMDVEEERIASHERIAMHAIDTHARLLEKRWQLGVNDHE